MIIFINNKSTKFCQITQCIKRFIHKKKSGSFFLPHGVHTFKYIFTRWTMDFLIWSQILPSWPYTSAWRTHQVCVTFISISAGYQLSSFYFTCCKKVAHTRTRLPSVGFRSWSRFLAVSSQVTWVINPAVGCHYFSPGPQLPSQPLRGLLRISLLGEQRHDGREQFAWDCYPTASRLRIWNQALLLLSPAR